MGNELIFYGSGGYQPVKDDNPLPVKLMADVQSANIVGRTWQIAPDTTTPTLIAAANPNRRSILITNKTGAQIVYVGFEPTVAATSGGYLAAAAGSSITIAAKGAIYGLSISAAQTLAVLEESYVSP